MIIGHQTRSILQIVGCIIHMNSIFECRKFAAANLLVSNMSGRFSRTIYVGNLPSDIREREVEDLFYKVVTELFTIYWLFGYELHLS